MKLAIIIGCVVLLIIITILVCVLLLRKKKGTKKIKIDEIFINNLISYLGDCENINSVNTENGRLIIKVKDLDSVNLDSINSLAEGVFVTGNTIKTLFRQDSQLICSVLEKRIK